MNDVITAAARPQLLFSLPSLASILRQRASSKLPSPTNENRVTDLVARVAACCLVAASSGFGGVYAWSTGSRHGVVLGALSVLFAIALEVVKPLALRNALTALRQFQAIRGAALGILAAAAVVYSLTAELSLWAAMRSDGIAQRQSAITVATRGEKVLKRGDDRYAEAKAELDALQPARSNADVQAEITTLLAANPRAGDCRVLDGKVTRSICPRVDALKAEGARAGRREALQREMAIATAEPAISATAPKSADPGAEALVTYLGAMGFGRVDVNILSEWLSLVPVLALEIGSLFAGLLCAPSPRTPNSKADCRCSAPATLAPAEMPTIPARGAVFMDGQEAFTADTEKLSVSDCPAERLVHLLRSSGGTVFGGQRSFGKAINISAAQVNSLLHELAAAGTVTLDVSKNGTRVRLAA